MFTAPDATTASPVAASDLAQLRASADSACRMLKALSNPDRLLLLCQLAQGEMRVGELEARVGVLQPTLSQQLGVLRDEGLVRTRREGKAMHYSIAQPQVLALLELLYRQYCGPQASQAACNTDFNAASNDASNDASTPNTPETLP